MIGPGLVWTCWQGEDRVVLAEAPPPSEVSFRWFHLDLWDQRSARWIAEQSDLPADVQALFLASDDQPRALGQHGALALVLPDFEREFDREETERIGALRVALRPGLMLTGRYHPLHTPDIFRHRAAQAETLDASGALELILNSLADTLALRTGAVLSALVGLEDKLLADQDTPDTRALVSLRRLTARLFRMAGGMHTTLMRAVEDPSIGAAFGEVLARAERRLQPIERHVVAAQGQLRLLREELDLQAGQRTNENVYLLSVITALIMPATLVTGFFGMNTDGMPFEHGAGGTMMASVLAIGSSLVTWLLLRSTGLIRR
ncbi:CorA family divalent cation transporter [Sphingomonas crusticola]|uniref:CorA family divalent cation transporter n=1 Tax=Sphingomonas crusticola TaxID=1697973 RepID=UPI000E2569B3|nr:CorA family divalent cation transporter [Sphingomonas crusticola]